MEERRIFWDSVRRKNEGGVIEGETPLGYIVRMDSGKYVIVHKESIKQ